MPNRQSRLHKADEIYETVRITGTNGFEVSHIWFANEQRTLCNFYLNFTPAKTTALTSCSECQRLWRIVENQRSLNESRDREKREREEVSRSLSSYITTNHAEAKFSSLEVSNPTHWNLSNGECAIVYAVLDNKWKRLFTDYTFLSLPELTNSQITIIKTPFIKSWQNKERELLLGCPDGALLRRTIKVTYKRAWYYETPHSPCTSVLLPPPFRIQYEQHFRKTPRLRNMLIKDDLSVLSRLFHRREQ